MDKRKKILWLSNAVFEDTDRGISGTWLHAMSKGLMQTGLIELGNITSGKVDVLKRADYGQIKQWIVPHVRKTNHDGLPGQRIVNYYLSAINDFKPDLIHIWGVESYPALITTRKHVDYPTLIEIQGLKGAIAEFYDSGLTIKEKIRCVGIKEIIRKSSIFHIKKSYKKWGKFEEEIILNNHFITTPSIWMEANVKSINRNAFLFQNEIPLRNDFFLNKEWIFSGNPIIFCSASSPDCYKGLHVIIRAMELLKKSFPSIQLRIAGAHQVSGLRKNGYIHWLNKQIKGANLESHIKWLGTLNSAQLVQELFQSAAVVLPSYIESYGVAHAEAMVVGTPCVCAFNGGSAYLAENEKTALFFQPGDHVMCAYQVERILLDKALAQSLSHMARTTALLRHNTKQIISKQIKIYEEVIAKSE